MFTWIIASIHLKITLNTQLGGGKASLINNQLICEVYPSIGAWQEALSTATVKKEEIMGSSSTKNKQHISILAGFPPRILTHHHPLSLEKQKAPSQC